MPGEGTASLSRSPGALMSLPYPGLQQPQPGSLGCTLPARDSISGVLEAFSLGMNDTDGSIYHPLYSAASAVVLLQATCLSLPCLLFFACSFTQQLPVSTS